MATTATVTNLLIKFEVLLKQEEANLLDDVDVRVKIDWIREQLQRAESDIKVIEDGHGQQQNREETSKWLAEVTDIACTSEDLLDIFILRKKQRKKQNIILRYTFFIFDHLAYRRKFLDEFDVVESRMNGIHVTQRHLILNNREKREDASSDFMDVRPPTVGEKREDASSDFMDVRPPTVGKNVIIGLEDDLKLLKSRLVGDGDDPKRRVISIVGLGGMGKTTLAQLVYNNNDVVKHFDIRVWICVAEESTEDVLINNIFDSFMSSAQSKPHRDERVRTLHNYLKEKRYLIVLDDVWVAQVWEIARRCFPDVGNGSRVLLTTRSREVAFAIDPSSPPHDMQEFTAENSWMLFSEIVGMMETDPPELIELGKKFANICRGVPLAIRVMGGFLSRKDRTVTAWCTVLNAYGELADAEDNISRVLELSYKELPCQSVPLFLYLLVFPIDYEIPLRRLLGVWLAEGFLKFMMEANYTDRVEDLAKQILQDLIDRSMIQVVRWKLDGKPKTCRVHSRLREAFLSKARDIGFFHYQNRNSGASLAQPTSAVRRLVEYTDIHDYSSLEPFIQNSRSYISFNFRKGDIPAELTGRFLARVIQKRSFGLLGVLDLERVYKPKLPESLGKLHLLKYLGLRWTFLDAIPSSVGDLLNLETLDVKHTYISRLPSSIRKMKKLQHLYLNEIHLDLSAGDIALQNLQTLWGLTADREFPLPFLITLTKLGLTVQDTLAEVYAEWILRLTALRILRFRSQDEYGRPSDLKLGSFYNLSHLHDLYLLGRLTNPLHALQLPKSLTVLTLSVSGLEQDPMPTLELLPNLCALRLFARSYTGKRMVCSNGGFPSLRILKLWMLEELEEWIIEEGAMLSLKQLEIRCCNKLKKCLKNVQQLFSLKDLILTNMPKEFVAEVEAGNLWHVSLTLNNWEFPTFPDQESSLGGEGSG